MEMLKDFWRALSAARGGLEVFANESVFYRVLSVQLSSCLECNSERSIRLVLGVPLTAGLVLSVEV